MLKGKTVLLGITGSIAAYKIAYLASALHKLHADVHVLMTENATNFINPITFETLTGNKCLVDTFDRNFQFQVEHVSIAKKADVVMIAPASANVIGKLANGLADDMLTTTVMACRCQKILAPAMNTAMYENPVTQDNIELLKHYGMEVITPASGHLACGDSGAGKMPEPETLFQYICKTIAHEKDMAGMKVLVTAGPTQEAIDPVRYITNHSSGKMGYSIAKACILSVRFHDLNHFAYREFISLFNPVQSVFNLSYDTKICVLSDIRITVINLAFFTWFSKIKSCRELTIGTI